MAIKKTIRIRKDLVPVNTSCTLAYDGSTLIQSYDVLTKTYSPSRQLSPLSVRPIVQAYASDGSMAMTQVNKDLGDCAWYAQVVTKGSTAVWTKLPLTATLSDVVVDSITVRHQNVVSGDNKGQISIYTNLAEGIEMRFRFEGKYVDPNVGTTLTITSDAVSSRTQSNADEVFSMVIADPLNILYNPLRERNYKKSITVQVRRGKDIVSLATVNSLVDVLVCNPTGTAASIGSTSVIESVVKGSDVVINLNCGLDANPHMFDIRLVSKADSKVLMTRRIVLNRAPLNVDVINTNNTPFKAGEVRADMCIVTYNGKKVDNPADYFTINWYYSKTGVSGKAANAGVGEKISFTPSESIIGADAKDFDYWIEINPKPKLTYTI